MQPATNPPTARDTGEMYVFISTPSVRGAFAAHLRAKAVPGALRRDDSVFPESPPDSRCRGSSPMARRPASSSHALAAPRARERESRASCQGGTSSAAHRSPWPHRDSASIRGARARLGMSRVHGGLEVDSQPQRGLGHLHPARRRPGGEGRRGREAGGQRERVAQGLHEVPGELDMLLSSSWFTRAVTVGSKNEGSIATPA